MSHELDWDFVWEISERLCRLGKTHRDIPPLTKVEPFKHFFSGGKLKLEELNERDGGCTRREIIARYLLVNVVLDQGPDMVGVRELLKNVTNELYRREVRIFHTPIEFFEELGISIDEILNKHESIKRIRARDWAAENNSRPSQYSLFFAQSMRGIVPIKQVLDYAIHRWGAPLCIPLLLEKDLKEKSPEPLIKYLESWESAEIMAQQLKDHERYGLGSAIGDKACHLFAKWYVSVFKLVKWKTADNGWSDISYELPLDSNAGRVLFRTGFLLEWATIKEYEKWNVVQKGKGKGGRHYIRVTNIRGKSTQKIPHSSELFRDYVEIVSKNLKIGSKPRNVQIQRVVNLLVYRLMKEGKKYSVADFDDGLVYVGTKYCFNHQNPKCIKCPLGNICKGYNMNQNLIEKYRT
jgi:hypothetical protein